MRICSGMITNSYSAERVTRYFPPWTVRNATGAVGLRAMVVARWGVALVASLAAVMARPPPGEDWPRTIDPMARQRPAAKPTLRQLEAHVPMIRRMIAPA